MMYHLTTALGRARPPDPPAHRSPGGSQVDRPLRLRPALLQPLPQRRHPGAPAHDPGPRVGGDRDGGGLGRDGPEAGRQRRPRGRPALRRVQAVRPGPLQHLPADVLPLLGKELPPRPGHPPGADRPPGSLLPQAARGGTPRAGRPRGALVRGSARGGPRPPRPGRHRARPRRGSRGPAVLCSQQGPGR